MANPVGEDSWLAYVEEARRKASGLEQRVNILELYKRAVSAEPGSLKVWLAYCEYLWALYTSFHTPGGNMSRDEQVQGRELFSLDVALRLWLEAYDAIKYRIADSHELWNRWISLEMEMLAKTRTPEGVRRITHLYRDRLQIPHVTWDQTSHSFWSFLTEYNKDMWEQTMQEVTAEAQVAKRLLHARSPFETKLAAALKQGDDELYRATLREYLEWEVIQSRRNNDKPEIAIPMCCGLFDRALTGVFALDDVVWNEYAIFLSSSQAEGNNFRTMLAMLQRAVHHCPWSGALWSRYILCAEEAKLPFSEIEDIKHAATGNPELFRYDMTGLMDMYCAWCGFLKRNAMAPGSTDEATDVADLGLAAALEGVAIEGERRWPTTYQGDPEFRLERIYIQFLTEKKRLYDNARRQWLRLAARPLHANSHEFWLRYYMWEMMIFASEGSKEHRSPTPNSASSAGILRVPVLATSVLARAVKRRTLDWPEKVMQVYLQHCNDYETPEAIRHAISDIHRAQKTLARMREIEASKSAAAAQAYQAEQLAQQATETAAVESPSGPKRKREEQAAGDDEGTSKRARTDDDEMTQASLKRDRENTSVVVEQLPVDVTQTKLKAYFKEYGHINSLSLVQDADGKTSTALIEFSGYEEAESALLRDSKYFDQSQIRVRPGHNLTLYVTNYPPEADEPFVRGLFKDCGEILSVRWPSLKYNTHRRFCYVSFRNLEAAAKATQKDGKTIRGKYKLVAKYSNPGQKKQREGAVAELREVHVGNLASGATEEELRELFRKFGQVARVNIPRSMAGKGRGFAFVELEDKDQAAAAAADLNLAKFKGQILQVNVTKEKNFKASSKLALESRGQSQSPLPSPAPTRDGGGDGDGSDSNDGDGDGKMQHVVGPTAEQLRARTITISNLPDTINDARVRTLVEPAGSIVKLVLQPGNGTARVEFEDEAAVGKAELRLQGVEMEGRTIAIGHVPGGGMGTRTREREKDDGSEAKSKADGRGGGAEVRQRRTALPFTPASFIRRPVAAGTGDGGRGARGAGGRRGGLGFVGFVGNTGSSRQAALVPTSVGGEKEKNPPSEQPRPASTAKSNADFRAMFIKSAGAVATASASSVEEEPSANGSQG